MSCSGNVTRAAGALMGCALLLGIARDAAACSVLLPDTPESVSCGAATDAGAHTAAPALVLQVDTIEVRRSSYAPPGLGDCGELGVVGLRFRLADGATWPGDVGVLINHVSGEFPWFQPPLASTSAGTGWLLRTHGGEVSFFGPDDPRQPLNVHLVARLLDCAGATSAPIDVVITDPGRPEDPPDGVPEPTGSAPESAVDTDAGVGQLTRSSPGTCAMSLPRRDAGAWRLPALVLFGMALWGRSRRRRVR